MVTALNFNLTLAVGEVFTFGKDLVATNAIVQVLPAWLMYELSVFCSAGGAGVDTTATAVEVELSDSQAVGGSRARREPLLVGMGYDWDSDVVRSELCQVVHVINVAADEVTIQGHVRVRQR